MRKKHSVKSQYTNPDGHIRSLKKKIEKLEKRAEFLKRLLGDGTITWKDSIDVHGGSGLLPPNINVGDGIKIHGTIIKTNQELDQNDGTLKFSYSFKRESTNILPLYIEEVK